MTERAVRGRARSWLDREPGLRDFLEETGRLFRRARQRRAWVLGLTLAAVALFGAREARKQRNYPAEVVLSATEGKDAGAGVAHTSAKLQDYVYYAVFTDAALLQVMKEHGYRPDLLALNPRMALDNFRDDLNVSLYKNEFTQPRFGGVPRSARIAIEIHARDPDQALALARALGDLVVKRDAENRQERFDVEQHLAREIVGYARDDLARTESALAEAALEVESAAPARAAMLRVEIANLEKAAKGGRERLEEAEQTRARLEALASSDSQNLTLRYDRVEWGAPAPRVNEPVALARNLLVVLLGLLPVIAMGVGAFDPRVYGADDVRRSGLRALGVVRTRGA